MASNEVVHFPGYDEDLRIYINSDVEKLDTRKIVGTFTFAVRNSLHDSLLNSLRNELGEGRYVKVVENRRPLAGDSGCRRLVILDHGFLTRQKLAETLLHLDEFGVDSSWLYVDMGTVRNTYLRRVLGGPCPKAPVTEYDYRQDLATPCLKEYPVGDLWTNKYLKSLK